VDFSLQFRLATDNEKIEKHIFNILEDIANSVDSSTRKVGAIVVFGDFSQSRQCIEGLVQMKPKQNPITSLIMIDTDEGAETVETFSRYPHDGAIVVDKTGQNNDVISVLTLSEETNTIRLWRDGKEEESHKVGQGD
jgi:DNA integrity scanning protein DisA with diadenylate cyclase activity